MILSIVRMTIPPKIRGQVSKTLKSMVREARIKPGCLSSRLYHDESEEAVFVCEQVWRNQDDLNLHLRSEDYRRMLLVMELAAEPPEIKFQKISETAGIEVIEKARGATINGDV
jgi:quinol monooxygenase YgiN